METSDSECFESADEDFSETEDNTQTVVEEAPKKNEVQKLSELCEKVDKFHVESSSLKAEALPEKTVQMETEKIQVETVPEKIAPKEAKKLGKKVQKVHVESGSKEIKEDIPEKPSEKVVQEQPLKVEVEESKPEGKEDNLWDDEELDWGKEAEVEQKQEEKPEGWDHSGWESFEKPSEPKEQTWGTWGTWGVTSILSTATQGVSTLTNQVSQGISTVIGVPNPEELARINVEELKQTRQTQEVQGEQTNLFGFGTLVNGVTKLVESTGNRVIQGGLDTLETIGKKTMEVLQEGDPGLKNKRAFLGLNKDKPVLSQVLREAKERAEQEPIKPEATITKRTTNYETLFDDHQGLVHLEALEMLSRQCDIKLQTICESLSGNALIDLQETLEQVKELCELPEEEDQELTFEVIEEKIKEALLELNVPISFEKLLQIWHETEAWLKNIKLEIVGEEELHQQAIESLAQLTAIVVEQFHKTGELLLVKEHRSTADEADSLVLLTTILAAFIGLVAGEFTQKLNGNCKKPGVNELITNIFFESANSSSYIQSAFQLLIPVMQVGTV